MTPGIASAIEDDPRGWISDQIAGGVPLTRETLSTHGGIRGPLDVTRARRAGDRETLDQRRKALNRMIRAESAERLGLAIRTDRPFADRWVAFWSNHFAMSVGMGTTRALGGPYEREAIRAHAFGRFEDMLLAVAAHPAMLVYLDNQSSVGPNSPTGQRRDRGLNENFGRELLELHTLGVDGGYTQGDVRELSLALTGWTVRRTPISKPGRPADGQFAFHAPSHEPGARALLGKHYGEGGREQAEAMLRDLARHPATARHVARKLATHFVSDPPPSALTSRLERTFIETDGDLRALARALVESDEAWTAPATRFLPPLDFIIAAARACPGTLPVNRALNVAREMGQPLWAPRSPEGYPQGDGTWLGPDGLARRLAHANAVADAMDPGLDVPRFARTLYGDGIESELSLALTRAEAARQGLTLLLMSSQFLRR